MEGAGGGWIERVVVEGRDECMSVKRRGDREDMGTTIQDIERHSH